MLMMALLALAGCGTSHDSDLDWGPWRYDGNLASEVMQGTDPVKAERLVSQLDDLSVKVVSDDRFRGAGMRDLMDEADVFATRDRAEMARIVAALASDGSRDSAASLPRPVNDVLILLFDRTLMRYTCIYAFETNGSQRWAFTSAQYAGIWTTARAESTLSALGVGHSVRTR